MRKRTLNFWRILAWVAGAVIVSGVVWAGVGGPVPTLSETGTAIPEKLGKNPAAGRVLQLPNGTDLRGAYWTTIETLPTGTAGQVLGVGTVTTTGTDIGTSWQSVNGTLAAGSNIRISLGTSTSLVTSGKLAESPVVHAYNLVRGSGSMSGNENYLVKKTSSGWGDSLIYQDSLWFYFYNNLIARYGSDTASDGTYLSLYRSRGTASSPSAIQNGDAAGSVVFGALSPSGGFRNASLLRSSVTTINGSTGYFVGTLCADVGSGTGFALTNSWCAYSDRMEISVPLTLSGTTGKGAGKVLYDTDGTGVIGEKSLAISDVSGLQTSLDAKPTLGTSPVVDVSINPPSSGDATQASRENHQHRLGSNYPAPGWLPFAYSTATSTATGTGNTIAWRQAQESDVAGLTTDLAAKEPLLPTGNAGDIFVLTGTSTSTSSSKATTSLTIPVDSPLAWRFVTYTGTSTTTGTATKTTANIITKSPTLTIQPRPITFACADTSSTALTFTGSLTLGGPGNIVVSVDSYTPTLSDTNKLRISAHISGQASGAAADWLAEVEAVTAPSSAVFVDGAIGFSSIAAASKYGSTAFSAIDWDANWSSSTSYRLKVSLISGTLVIPVSSNPMACLTIEELKQ